MYFSLAVRTFLVWYGFASIVAIIGLSKRQKIKRICASRTAQKVAEFIRPKHISSNRKAFVMTRKMIVIGGIMMVCSWAEKHAFFEKAGKSGELIIGSFVDHWIFPESEMD